MGPGNAIESRELGGRGCAVGVYEPDELFIPRGEADTYRPALPQTAGQFDELEIGISPLRATHDRTRVIVATVGDHNDGGITTEPLAECRDRRTDSAALVKRRN